jgi:hypothetical protein
MRAAIADRDAREDRRAAENFQRCGSIEEGMVLLRRVAGAIGYRATLTPTATIAALVVERARLRVRGLRPRRGDIDERAAERSDACYSLSTGLAMVDAISGALFQARSTRLALDSGDMARAARALAIEACFVSAWGSRTRGRATPIIDAAGQLATEVGDVKLIAFVETGRGICASQWGQFSDGVAACDRALAMFRAHCAGVAFEERTAEVFSIWNLAWRGDWGEVARRCDALARIGAATGERYAIMHAAIGPAICGVLASDEPERARARIDDVMRGWPRGRLDLPLVRELVARAIVDSYELRGRELLAELRGRWRELERSRMLGLEPIFGTLADLRMRAAVMARDWDEARVWARRLEAVPWGKGVAQLAHAAIAQRRGDRDAVVRALAAAEHDTLAAGLDLYALAARDRRGRLIGGDAGKAAVASAAEGARTRSIENPARVFASLAPWPEA